MLGTISKNDVDQVKSGHLTLGFRNAANFGFSPEASGIENTKANKGDEVVQLYVKDEVSSVTTYETQLIRFERISLNPGETNSAGDLESPAE